MNYDVASHLLPLKGSKNTRDLGNYPTTSGLTKNHVFYRSDSSSNFTPSDVELLIQNGLELIIDLRSVREAKEAPSPFVNMESVRYENVPMLDGLNSGPSMVIPASMGEVYIYLLENEKSSFQQIFTAFSETIAKNKACLFHCAVGKDRTGTTAMLLLNLAGARDEVIVADYSATYDFMKEVFEAQMNDFKQHGVDVPEYMFQSNPSDILMVLEFLKKNYGNAQNYLLECGMEENQLDVIRKGFIH